MQKFLPKEADIDKVLNVIQRKVLKCTHLPVTIKEIQATYLTSPYFKDLYLYLTQNKLPSKRSAIDKVEALAEKIHPAKLFAIQVDDYLRHRNRTFNPRDM